MIVAKFHLGIALAVAVATSAGLVWAVRENTKLRTEVTRQSVAAATTLAELKQQVTAASQRATNAEAEVATLLKAAQTPPPRVAVAPVASASVDTQDLLKAVTARAAQLIKEEKFQEALDEYVKAYRELQAKRPGSSECQSLMGALRSLGRKYPPALAALAELRDAATAQHAAHPDSRELVFEIALLNERLGQGSRTLALYDALPPNDPGRQSLAMIANTSFIEARRYADVLVGKRFGQMMNVVEAGSRQVAAQAGPLQEQLRKAVIDQTATNIEVLTGAGKLEDARMLTEKLFAFDGSEATREAVRQHMARAGQPAR